MKTYKILIEYLNGDKEEIDLTTDRLEWSMDQYQRNRQPLTYRVIAENYISKDDGSKADDSSSV